jgi:uncharacterized membrane protein
MIVIVIVIVIMIMIMIIIFYKIILKSRDRADKKIEETKGIKENRRENERKRDLFNREYSKPCAKHHLVEYWKIG